MTEDRTDSFLRLIRLSRRGRLKVYLGYSAGVGKTYQMLQEGHRLKAEGIDIVIGLLETHGRADIVRLAEGLEVVPRRRQEYHGIVVEELDPDAVLARAPQVALIDELAHTNVPGGRNAKRYEDVQDVLAAGIHVISTLNVQHLESLYNIVENSVGVRVRERLPDSVLAEADQIVDVDLATEDLRKRLRDGKIYPAERVEAALANFFTPSNLESLRELTLRELASQIDLRRRDTGEKDGGAEPDQVMVALSSHGPNSEKLLRFGSRLAGKLNRNWYAVYVQTPSEEATVIDAGTQRLLSDTLTLAKQLGAMVFTYKGEDIADTLLRFAAEYRVGHIVVGRSRPRPFWKKFGKNKKVVENLLRHAGGITVIVLDSCSGSSRSAAEAGPAPVPKAPANRDREGDSVSARISASILSREGDSVPGPAGEPEKSSRRRSLLSALLSNRRIVIWQDPVDKEHVLRALAASVEGEAGAGETEALFQKIMKREAEGSTFFSEGVAFPHVRFPGLASPVVALGLTRAGVSDVLTEKPIAVVFLILSPGEAPETQVEILGLASRAAQNRLLMQSLRSAAAPEEALRALMEFEAAEESARAKRAA